MRYILLALIAPLMAACVSNSPDLRPGAQAQVTEATSNPQLSDSTMRFVSTELTMVWDNGGIAFERLANGSIHGINLTTGDNFIFDAGKHDDDSLTLPNAALWINGTRIGYSSAEILCADDNIIWYKLTGYEENSDYYIIIDTNRLPEI